MNLIVDIGNTRTKYAIFEERKFLSKGIGIPELFRKVRAFRESGAEVNLILSSTGAISQQTRNELKEVATFFCEATPSMALPIRLGYETPLTLGIDRVAGCVGGAFLFPGKDVLIVDSGTAITFDFLRADGMFLGGNISPGMQIRFRALNRFTVSLPLVECSKDHGFMGRNTYDAILNGVMNGILFEVRGYIDAVRGKKPDTVVIITGGGAPFLKNSLNRKAYFEENLVIIGLNQMLEYQKTVNN